MKTKLAKKFINLKKKFTFTAALLFSAAVFFESCTPRSETLYNDAYQEIENGHFRLAINLLEQSAKLEKNDKKKTKALLEAARIARFEIQDFERSIRLYREIILKSQDSRQRINAQEAVAEVYLENLQNYTQALKDLLILEQLDLGSDQKEKIKLKIAQAQFLTGNADSSLDYIDGALKTAQKERKHLLKLKAEVLISSKKHDQALITYEELRKLDEVYFAEENLYIATSIAYEEKEDYVSALSYLDKYRDQIKDLSYLELREKRLKEKLTNKPLFKGRRK
ncbi:MAG: hypothetical protein A2622_05215 [Bdellovibrionales bacterium RIFCSPHIGHO2_01_FULL_40_29]|nr:MAG: hypothetical protein A2622_05215 [Bdellovibrionales bacterium RIFCSPHIGHO2_01_FULL_40_29]OFZ34674.1 MAG: hypothetical protein A3D17_10160 [Bdellovibrionales bacterium RIFCSPHIGHO2_02_FULL_40_15]